MLLLPFFSQKAVIAVPAASCGNMLIKGANSPFDPMLIKGALSSGVVGIYSFPLSLIF